MRPSRSSAYFLNLTATYWENLRYFPVGKAFLSKGKDLLDVFFLYLVIPMCFTLILPSFKGFISHVIRLSTKKKMIRINTRPIIAGVKDMKTFFDKTYMDFVRKSMCINAGSNSPNPKTSVPTRVFVTSPFMTRVKRNLLDSSFKYLNAFIYLLLVHQPSITYAQSFFKGPALIQTPTVTTTSGGTTTLTKDSQTIQIFEGPDPQTVVLPDATTIPVGRSFEISNKSLGQIAVLYGDSTPALTLTQNSTATFVSTDMSTMGGTWDANVTLGAMSYLLDGVLTNVSQDTGTPANSRPLPVLLLDPVTGLPYDAATETTLLGVLSDTNDLVGALSTDGGLPPASVSVVAGSDGTNIRTLETDTTGRLNVNVSGSALPSGAATEATLLLVETNTADTVTELQTLNAVDFATETTSAAILADTAAIDTSTASIDGKLPATLGQKTSANSLAVVPASDYIPAASGVPAAVTVKQAAVTVGTSAVRLTTDGSAPSATRRYLRYMLDPASSANCFEGSSSVTSTSTTRGPVVFPGAVATRTNDANDYYVICDAAAQTVFVEEAE